MLNFYPERGVTQQEIMEQIHKGINREKFNRVVNGKPNNDVFHTSTTISISGLLTASITTDMQAYYSPTSKIYLELRTTTDRSDKIDTTTISEHLQHLWLCIRSGIYIGFEENINKFKTFLNTIRNQQKFIMGYERWYIYSFIYYNRTGQFTKALEFLNSEKTTMSRVGDDFSMKAGITLCYFTAYNNYALKDYKAALKMVQRIMNNTNDEMEEFSFAKLQLMFIHYDLKNYELLEYQVRSYLRLMHKTERMYKCEKKCWIFLKLFPALIQENRDNIN